jgi:hypothetical protein
MNYRTEVALLLAKSPVRGLLRRTHRKLSRYISLAAESLEIISQWSVPVV